jgi:acetyl-CoA carboxylase biotin carboxyl carrier protein
MATEVTAHITGTVWKILVHIGQAVTEEEAVAILESMKMEMPVESPASGTVTAIAVKEGQSVEEGDVLLVLDGD